MTGALNNDWLVGGLGNDRINGSGGDNVIWGDNSPTLPTDPQPQDLLVGGDDILSGLTGADVFYGGGGNDYAYGGQVNDVLDGNEEDDRLYGGLGNDILSGHNGNELLSGGVNDDKLYGAAGNDVQFGGSVANENSSWTSLASTSTYSAATYTNGTDNAAALLVLLAQWGSASNRGSIAAITHDGDNDDLFGSLGDDDFCWETADVLDNAPGITPPDFLAPSMGNDERFGPF